jgi:hypothetical protein
MKIKNIIYLEIFLILLGGAYFQVKTTFAQIDSDLYSKTANEALDEVLEPAKNGIINQIKDFTINLPNKISEFGFDRVKDFGFKIFKLADEWFENTTGKNLGEVWQVISRFLIGLFELIKNVIDRII